MSALSDQFKRALNKGRHHLLIMFSFSFSFFFVWSVHFPLCHSHGKFLCTLFNCLMIYGSLSKLLFFHHINHTHKQQTADAQPTWHNKRLQSIHSFSAAVYRVFEAGNTKLTQSIISNQLAWIRGKKRTYYRDLEFTALKKKRKSGDSPFFLPGA